MGDIMEGRAGQASCGIATSAPITLGADVPWSLEAWIYLDIEQHASCPGGFPFTDLFHVNVIDGIGESTTVWTKEQSSCAQYGKWAKRTFDLSAWKGETVQIQYSFDSWDNVENTGKGVAVDGMHFVKGCPAL